MKRPANLLIVLVLLLTLAANFIPTALWPFVPFEMFSKAEDIFFRDPTKRTINMYRVYGVYRGSEAEAERPLRWGETHPHHYGALHLALRQRLIHEGADSIIVSSLLAGLFSRLKLDKASGGNLLGLRLYMETYILEKELRNVRRPDRRELLGSYSPENSIR